MTKTHDGSEPIRTFATLYRVRTKCDACGEPTIPGQYGHVFDHADGSQFGVALIDNPLNKPSRAKALLARRTKALAGGFIASQIGDCESVLLFDPADPRQSRLAVNLVSAKRRRELSPEHREKLIAAGMASRKQNGLGLRAATAG